MRHRKRGRKLGRSSSHRRALLRNLASSLVLTERDAEYDENAPKVKGRITTTLAMAKEVRALVEKCITIARRSLEHEQAATQHLTTAQRGTEAWRAWRRSDRWQAWNAAIAPGVAARRRVLRLLGNKKAVRILFAEIAPRFAERPGGYTRIVRLAQPRVGDAGPQVILEFVGRHDRVRQQSQRPAVEVDEDVPAQDTADRARPAVPTPAGTASPSDEPASDDVGRSASSSPETKETPS